MAETGPKKSYFPAQSCSCSRNLKPELRSRDEAQKKYETQASPNRKASHRVAAAMAGCLKAVPNMGANAGCMQVQGIWLFHEADVVSQTSLDLAHVSITNRENVTEKKPKQPPSLVDKRSRRKALKPNRSCSMLGGSKLDTHSVHQFSCENSHHTGNLSRAQQFQLTSQFAR